MLTNLFTYIKGGPSDLRAKFYKNTKKSFLYSQGLLSFIYKIELVENHPTTGEIRELLRPRSTPTEISLLTRAAHPSTYWKVSNI